MGGDLPYFFQGSQLMKGLFPSTYSRPKHTHPPCVTHTHTAHSLGEEAFLLGELCRGPPPPPALQPHG